MQRLFFGKIHKIEAGPNPKDCMSYHVGQRIPKSGAVITEIAIDEFAYEKYGKISVAIFAKRPQDPEIFILKVFIDVPMTLTPDDKQD